MALCIDVLKFKVLCFSRDYKEYRYSSPGKEGIHGMIRCSSWSLHVFLGGGACKAQEFWNVSCQIESG